MYEPVFDEYILQIRQRKESNVRKFELILRRTKNIGQKKKRRDVSNHKKGRMAAALLGGLLTGTVLLSGMEMQVSAQTIRHTHSGDAQTGGECFGNPVYHVHEGNETEGGSCYGSPVYHVHTGDETAGGGCYGEEIVHTHEGSTSQGGACYRAVYHSHNDSCYTEGSHNSSCASHIEYHSYDCGTVHDWDGDGHGCDGFTAYDCGGHYNLICGRGGKITGYRLSCSMAEGEATGYGINCGKTEETIELYELTCTKTPEDIDYYEKTCGMEEGEEIYIPDPPEENTGDNGDSPGQDGSGDGNGRNSEDGGNGEDGGEGSDESSQEPLPTPAPPVEPVVKPSPSAIPVTVEVTEEAPAKKKEKTTAAKPSPTPELTLTPPSPSPTQQVLPKIVEEETVELPEAAAQPEDAGGEPLVLKRRWAVFTPVIKMVSITSGTVLTLAAIALLLLYLRRSVRVYNDNGKGRMKYLGRAAVTLSEEGYYIQITDKLEERAATNRYCIRPDLFLIGKNSSWEIYVVKNGKKKSVYLDKNMTFTI